MVYDIEVLNSLLNEVLLGFKEIGVEGTVT